MKYQVDVEKCILCLMCQNVCSNRAIEVVDSTITINQELCDDCGACATICPMQAIEEVTEKVPVKTEIASANSPIIKEKDRQKSFYPYQQVNFPNPRQEVKKSFFDGFLTSLGNPNFSLKGNDCRRGGKNGGKRRRKRNKW